MSNDFNQLNKITFADDQLKRKIYANSIIKLIGNSKYLAENESLVIALDSPWGTGKSVFVNMLKNQIDSARSEDEYSSIRAVLYNAWKNDYCEDPFESLFYDIVKNDIFDFHKDSENAKQLIKSIVSIGRAFSKDIWSAANLGNTEEALAKFGTDIKNFVFTEIPAFKALEEQRKAFDSFKQYLINASEWLKDTDHKLVIIIDELDRCKPLFAIRVLEIIKHLFDIPNIVFLLSVDFTQLKYSIATVYGERMDSEGYLQRFVNQILKLPEPSKSDYINFLLDTYPLKEDRNYTTDFIANLKQAFEFRGMSLRNINCIYENFRAFFIAREFSETDNNFSLPYLMLMIFKYKDMEIYDALVKNNNENIFYDLGTNNSKLGLKSEFRVVENICKGKIWELLRCSENMEKYLTRYRLSWPNKYSENSFEEIRSTYGDNIQHLFLTYIDLIEYKKYEDDTLSIVKYIAREIEIFI